MTRSSITLLGTTYSPQHQSMSTTELEQLQEIVIVMGGYLLEWILHSINLTKSSGKVYENHSYPSIPVIALLLVLFLSFSFIASIALILRTQERLDFEKAVAVIGLSIAAVGAVATAIQAYADLMEITN